MVKKSQNKEIVCGVDIGTTKICVMVAEPDEDGEDFNIIGIGQHPSKGLRKGVVVNLEQTIESIEKAVEEAEMMAGVGIENVYVGIAGDHIRSINSTGVIAISKAGKRRVGENNQITEHDIQRVLDWAKGISLPMDREILHVLPQEYIVDDQPGIKDPIGMSGQRLEARVHIVTGAIASAKNIVNCIKGAGLNVQDLVLEPLASSYAVLDDDEKDLGVAIIDIGGGTTDVAVFFEGGVQHTGVIGLGGENVTKDLAHMLRTPMHEAEQIKIDHGCAKISVASNDDIFEVPGIGGRGNKEINQEILAEYIEPRMEEMLKMAMQEIHKAECWPHLSAGVVLTGGGAMLGGLVDLAEEIFDAPVKLGGVDVHGKLMEKEKTPIYATGIGLVKYGFEHHRSPMSFQGDENKVFNRIVERMREWFNEFF
ncbi:MAG: cell division protein FtsA [Candidatus Marinimicrobia bacterium]|nr:cell division protein FtsA [Candidatus Neomarinimicrobiota bacterium]MCF7829630.1 cell division protein FtsA [Candidatus Neomarinimicrobiota bacterium]MCF7879790.1 cell division protein FtsA [Candidatus Neomarinimicrobiota bacterium]